MSFDKNGFDELNVAPKGKTAANGAGDRIVAVAVRTEAPARLGTAFGNGPQVVSDAQTARRPVTSPKQTDQNANLHVGKGVKLKGDIHSCGMLTIEGEIEARATVGHLQIASGGSFNGAVMAEEAEIDGRFDGILLVSGKLVVRRGGRVAGRLTYGQIEVERGAEIRGRISAQFGPHKKSLSSLRSAPLSWFLRS